MTTIYTHDLKPCPACNGLGSNLGPAEKLTPLPMAGLAIAAWNLLDQAADLPQPQMITVYDTQHVSFQFPGEPDSHRAISRWARRFGGVFTSGPRDTERGRQTWCRAEFDYYGVTVDAYAHIPAATATT